MDVHNLVYARHEVAAGVNGAHLWNALPFVSSNEQIASSLRADVLGKTRLSPP
jgi:hypothetical protein